MKRTAVRPKRKKAGAGAKRAGHPRRSPAKVSSSSKSRRAAESGRSRGTISSKTRRAPARRKTARRREQSGPPGRRVKAATPAQPVVKALRPVAARKSASEPAVASRPRQRKPAQPAGDGSAAAGKTVLARGLPLKIPPILLEGDEPEFTPAGGPGDKFVLGPGSPATHFTAHAGHLPASYGTRKLFLTARDPHWLYAHWDIPPREQFQHNARSVDRHMILRLYAYEPVGSPVAEIHVHPESHHWFVPVEQAGARYVAELGYYQSGRKWKSLATSAPMSTPPDTISTDSTVEFATIPPDLSFDTLRSLLGDEEAQRQPLAHAIQRLRDRRLREHPASAASAEWTTEQELALAKLLASARGGRALRGSEESHGLPGDFPESENLPAGLASHGWSPSFAEYVASPLGGAPVSGEFWFSINAELIIHGATEPNAQVSLGGKPITLQPDGSFSFRFALPDGQYTLPVVAVSADNTDGRAVQLDFSRSTETFGNVGAHPTDPWLQPPVPGAI